MKEKKKPLDPTYAPEGYEAIPMPESAMGDCEGCAFSGDTNCPAGNNRPCICDEHPDGWDVIFVLKES